MELLNSDMALYLSHSATRSTGDLEELRSSSIGERGWGFEVESGN